MYSGLITEMRQTDRRHSRHLTVTNLTPAVLVRPDRLRPSSQPPLSLPSTLSLPATVPDQDQTEVLDLSSSRRNVDDQTPQAPVTTAAPVAFSSTVQAERPQPSPAHSRERESDNSSSMSLVGALRRLGTNVNLVPVNFSLSNRSRSQSPGSVTVTRTETETRQRERSLVRSRHRHRDRPERHRLILPSRQSLGLGVALPLAEATRLLNNSWDQESVRQADMFISSLATNTTNVTASSRVDSEYYNPPVPTEDSTDSSDSNTATSGNS